MSALGVGFEELLISVLRRMSAHEEDFEDLLPVRGLAGIEDHLVEQRDCLVLGIHDQESLDRGLLSTPLCVHGHGM